MDKKFVFRKNSSSTPNRKVKIFHNKSGNTNTRLKYLVSSERLQNTILNGSSTTEKANEDLLSTKPTATDFGRNSGNVDKDCTIDTNDKKTKQQPRIPRKFVFIKEIGWRKQHCDQSKRSE